MILKQLRTLKLINQQKLADLLGVSRSTVTMWELNATQPDNRILQELSKYFGVSVDVILGMEGDVLPNGKLTDWTEELFSAYRSADARQRLEMFKTYGVPKALAGEYWKLRFPDKPAVPDAVSGANSVTIASRDGTVLLRQLTDEQLTALKAIVAQLPDVGDL